MSTPATGTGDERVEGDTTLAALSHASALFASFLGPILFLVLADDDDELVKRNAKNSLNFQIVVFVALMIAGVLSFVFVGLLLFPIIAIADLILVLIATVRANDGEVYSYPYTPKIV
ncbi:DUF4870 domain-containing protein [Halorubrum sp. SD626R]|jgi:uncharacterized Tic20 family protein|uniref:DUF4870 domain-containing protein n=1 Tax=Halorubrum sp. SD626R TaxID=1419722 RepID=UPI000B14259A|nr:DUF4870 domain-containing protein [Halorubrum sp. SD626R]TKX81510.1 DUF4870 domain-containing protein [Halorubrum sp. SD626R]